MTSNKLEGLEIFIKVAELNNFSKAAEMMGLSKAHVSRMISRLEQRLGSPLLTRTTRNVSLTDDGRAFYQSIKKSFLEIETAEQSLIDQRHEPSGLLKISAAGAFAERYVGPVACDLVKAFPSLRLDIHFTSETVDLIGEEYDLGIRSGVLKSSSLISRRIDTRRLYVCASPSYFNQQGIPMTLNDLKAHQCLVGSSPYWHFRDSKGGHKQIKISGNISCNNAYVCVHAAIQGLGLTQLPEYYLEEAIAQKKLIRCLETYQATDTGVWAVYPENRRHSPKVRLFIDKLVDTVSNNRQ